MGLNIGRRYSTKIKILTTAFFAISAFIIQPYVNVPQVFASGLVTVSSVAELESALTSTAQSGDTISIESDLTLTKAVSVTKAININGNGHTISAPFVKTGADNNAAVIVLSNNVTIKNLSVEAMIGSDLHGINIYQKSGIILNDVSVKNFRSGVVVNGADVSINNINTLNNTWHGINVDRTSAHLTITGNNTHNESTPIYVDNRLTGAQVSDPDSLYVSKHINLHGTHPNDLAYKLRSTIPVLTVDTPVDSSTAATVSNGNKLKISGRFTDDIKANYASLQLVRSGVSVATGIVYGYGSTFNPIATYAGPDGTYTYYMTVPADIADGQYSLFYTGTDFTGNVTDRMERRFVIDNTAPSVPLAGLPNNSYKRTNTFDFTWGASADNNTGVTYEFQSSLSAARTDGILNTNVWRSPSALSAPTIHSTGAPDGAWHWQVRSVDTAGNKSAWSAIWKMTIDTHAPTGEITSPANNATMQTVDGKFTVSGTVSDNLAMNRVGVQLVKPGVSGQIQYLISHMVNKNPGVWQVEFDAADLNLQNGTYGLNLAFVDMAGNVSTKKSFMTLNNPAPSISAEDFGVGSWTLPLHNFTGINVGFSIQNFKTVSGITVDLYEGDALIASNTSSSSLIEMINTGDTRVLPHLSTAFATQGVISDDWCSGVSCWDLGPTQPWTHNSNAPTKAVIRVTGTDAYGLQKELSSENTMFSQAASVFKDILPVVATDFTTVTPPISASAPQASPSPGVAQPPANRSLASANQTTTADTALDNTEAPASNSDVLGVNDSKNNTTAGDAPDATSDVLGTNDIKQSGLAWYWWAAIILAAIGLIWLLVGLRRRSEEAL